MSGERTSGAALLAELERRFVTANTRITLLDHVLELLHPRAAEDLIDERDFARDERLPYWADLWPSSVILAEGIISSEGSGLRFLELGCGLGLVAMAAVVAGFDVLATDYYDDALCFTRANVWRNTGGEPRTRLVDWRDLPGDLGTFDVVAAADVLYERPNSALVADAFAATLGPRGLGLLADPGRSAAPEFVTACATRGLVVSEPHRVPYSSGDIRQTIAVYQIQRS